MKKIRIAHLMILMGLILAGCSTEETETCGDKLPAEEYSSLPPIEYFETISYNTELGRVVLRWHADAFQPLCTASNTQAEIELDAEVKSCTARIRLAAIQEITFKLKLKGKDRWKATSPKIPIRRAYDNNPGEFSLSLDFEFDYRGAVSSKISTTVSKPGFTGCTFSRLRAINKVFLATLKKRLCLKPLAKQSRDRSR